MEGQYVQRLRRIVFNSQTFPKHVERLLGVSKDPSYDFGLVAAFVIPRRLGSGERTDVFAETCKSFNVKSTISEFLGISRLHALLPT